MNMFNGVVILSIWTVMLCHDVCSAETQQEVNDKLTERLNALTERLNATQQMVVKLQSKCESETDTLRGMVTQAMMLDGVAFTVYIPSESTSAGILPFSRVLLNHGNHFNTNTYKFTCPIDGIYFFIYNLYSGRISATEESHSGGKLYVDGVHQTTAKSWTYTNSLVAMHETGSAVARCHAGKKVWVEMYMDTDVQVFGSHIKETTFSGFLLYRL